MLSFSIRPYLIADQLDNRAQFVVAFVQVCLNKLVTHKFADTRSCILVFHQAVVHKSTELDAELIRGQLRGLVNQDVRGQVEELTELGVGMNSSRYFDLLPRKNMN